MPVRLRLAIVFALAAVVLVGGSEWLLIHLLAHELDSSVDTTLSERAPVIASTLGRVPELRGIHPPGVRPAFPFSHGVTEESGTTRDIVPAAHEHFIGHFGLPIGQVIGKDGEVLASLPATGSTPIVPRASLAAARRGPVHLDVVLSGARGPARILAEPDRFLPGAVVVVGASTGGTVELEHRLTVGLLLVLLPTALVAGVGAWVLAGAALRPVERLRSEAESISASDTKARLVVPSTGDEIAALASTMDELLGRMQEALERQRAFVSDASHELRTPLAALETELELAGRPGRTSKELAAAVSVASRDAERIRVLTENLLVLARSDEHGLALNREPTLLAEVCTAAARTVSKGAARGASAGSMPAVEVKVELEDSLKAYVDRVRIRQVLDNLLSNAMRFAPGGSEVLVRASSDEDGTVIIEVSDSGPGFPPAFLPVAFERFSRPDAARGRADGGSGLGLSIVKVIAEAHGGTAEASNLPSGGAHVEVRLHRALIADPGPC